MPNRTLTVAGATISFVAASTLTACTAPDPAPTPSATPSIAAAGTLRTLIDAEPESPEFALVQDTTDYDGDSAQVVSYESGGLDVQAVIRRPPSGAGGPAVVLVHGSADPDDYTGLTYYDDWADLLVDSGYTVVMPDLRNHADSDDDPAWETDLEMGTTLDVINAVRATSADPAVDADRIAVVGHSLGGAIALNVAVVAPDIASAYAALEPSHGSPWVNVSFFAESTPFMDRITALHGTAEDNAAYWEDVSSLTFVDRATAPLLVVRGTAEDEVLPVEWSDELVTTWTAAGKDVELAEIEGADHGFDRREADLMDLVTSFLAAHSG